MSYEYRITLHISRDNSLIGTYINIPFVGSLPRQTDEIRFTKQTILIIAVRTKRFGLSDIMKKNNNSLYIQILKSLIFLYVSNGIFVNLNSIKFIRKSKRTTSIENYDFSDEEKPLNKSFVLPFFLPESILTHIWEETKEAYQLRSILTHYLCASSSNDRTYIFERLWRAFEQLCLYNNRNSPSNSDFEALRTMRMFICTHTEYFPDSINVAANIGERLFRSFNWEN